MEPVMLQLQDVDLFSSMSVRVDIINFVIVKIRQMLPSVTELIEIWLNTTIQLTEVFTKSGATWAFGLVLSTCTGIGIPDQR